MGGRLLLQAAARLSGVGVVGVDDSIPYASPQVLEGATSSELLTVHCFVAGAGRSIAARNNWPYTESIMARRDTSHDKVLAADQLARNFAEVRVQQLS